MIPRRAALALGPLLALATWLLTSGLDGPARATAAITVLCATWWILEPVEIPVTSLLPFALLPLFGVVSHGDVAKAYGHTLILLLLGGFILSTAMEKSGAHRRLALGMVRLVGGRGGRGMVLGFMLASGLLSMWISNTATVLMLLPVALAVLEADSEGELAKPVLLGIAYAASIGGIGTPIGTPPNVIFMGIYEQTTGRTVSFLEWMGFGVPVVVAFLPIAWLVLSRRLGRGKPFALAATGPWRPAERRVLTVFGLTALAWMTRTEPFGGWSALAGVGKHAGDATVALAAVLVLFLLPDGEGGRLLDWETARRIPWGLLILFGGGIALAGAFETSGLSNSLGNALAALASGPRLVTVAGICLAVTFLTEVTSNTATTTLLMPILAAAGIASGIEPGLLMAPAALSASCAFMLPVATAPNAIVYGTGKVTTREMARTGLVLNFIGAAIITIATLGLWR